MKLKEFMNEVAPAPVAPAPVPAAPAPAPAAPAPAPAPANQNKVNVDIVKKQLAVVLKQITDMQQIIAKIV